MTLAKNPEVGQIVVFHRRLGIGKGFLESTPECKIENYTYTCIIMRDTIII